jgi:hypothetical protein
VFIQISSVTMIPTIATISYILGLFIFSCFCILIDNLLNMKLKIQKPLFYWKKYLTLIQITIDFECIAFCGQLAYYRIDYLSNYSYHVLFFEDNIITHIYNYHKWEKSAIIEIDYYTICIMSCFRNIIMQFIDEYE